MLCCFCGILGIGTMNSVSLKPGDLVMLRTHIPDYVSHGIICSSTFLGWCQVLWFRSGETTYCSTDIVVKVE